MGRERKRPRYAVIKLYGVSGTSVLILIIYFVCVCLPYCLPSQCLCTVQAGPASLRYISICSLAGDNWFTSPLECHATFFCLLTK